MEPIENCGMLSLSYLSFLDFRLKTYFYHRVFTMLAILIFTLNIIFFLLPNQDTVRKNSVIANSAVKKTAMTIRIEPGDSLWSIAQEYYTPECGTLKEYIKEIKTCNRLRTETIHAGRYLVVPHYIPDN